VDLHNIREHLKNVISKLPEDIQDKVIISGGCIASLLRDEEVEDYDIFFKEKSYIYDFVTRFASENKIDVKYKDEIPYLSEYGKMFNINGNKISRWAITILKTKMQFIIKDTFRELKPQFDYVHCTYSYDLKYGFHFPKFNEYNVNDLIVQSTMIANKLTLQRLVKFIKRGWNISASELNVLTNKVKEYKDEGDEMYEYDVA